MKKVCKEANDMEKTLGQVEHITFTTTLKYGTVAKAASALLFGGVATMAGLFFSGKTPKKSLKCAVVKSDMLSGYESYVSKVAAKVDELKGRKARIVCVSSDSFTSKFRQTVWYSAVFYR